jgi:hypothetical protein
LLALLYAIAGSFHDTSGADAISPPDFRKARVAVACKLAVILHAMWKTNTPSRWSTAVHDQLHATLTFNGASPPGRLARIRSTPLMQVSPGLGIIAWTTWADPASDANMWRSMRPTPEENSDPGESANIAKSALDARD